MKNTFFDDLKQPLDKVQRKWIRRPSLILITPVIFILGAITGLVELTVNLYKDCW